MQKCMRCMRDYEPQQFCPHCGAENELKSPDRGQIPAETILARRFIIGEVLGRDRIGFTYLAWDALLERKVVVREWFPAEAAQRSEDRENVSFHMDQELAEKLTEQFLEQGRILNRLQNISVLVPVYTSFCENGTAYYVMEYLEGCTLKEMLQRTNPFPLKMAQEIMEKVHCALELLHEQGLLHGNLAPENLFFDREGNVRLLNPAWFTKEMEAIRYSVFWGEYAPFSYYRQPVVKDMRLDQFGECAVYYRLLTGEAPAGASKRLKKAKLPSISDYGIEVPTNLEKQILKGLKESGGRKIQSGSRREKFFRILSIPLLLTAVILGAVIFLM